MMRDLTLAMPLNNALARDVGAILQGNKKRSWVADSKIIVFAGRAALLIGLIAAILAALFALIENAGTLRWRAVPAGSHSRQPVVRNFPAQNIMTARPPAPARISEALAPAPPGNVDIVPEPAERINHPVVQRQIRPSTRSAVARPVIKDAISDRWAVPVVAKAVEPASAQDRPQVTASVAPAAAAGPAASRETERPAGDPDRGAPAIDVTATEDTAASRLNTRRLIAIDAIRNLRRQ